MCVRALVFLGAGRFRNGLQKQLRVYKGSYCTDTNMLAMMHCAISYPLPAQKRSSISTVYTGLHIYLVQALPNFRRRFANRHLEDISFSS